MTSAKPFLKWAGGKSQLKSQLVKLFPSQLINGEIKQYFEPFLGSGAIFFHVFQKYKVKSALLYDVNPDLILTYQVVQRDVDYLIDELEELEQNYLSMSSSKREVFYYDIREKFNANKKLNSRNLYSKDFVSTASQFIFLNKTCYNGLYRVNSKGNFNVPIGRYKEPRIFDRQNMLSASKLLAIAEIRVGEYHKIFDDVSKDAFVYLDPPYRPISETSHFRSYTNASFDDSQQKELRDFYKALDSKGAFVMLSNSDPKNQDSNDNFFEDLYEGYDISRIKALRKINSVSGSRGRINEIVVRNYNN